MTRTSPKPSKAPTRDKVLASTRAGQTPRQISTALGISVQRVHQHLIRLRELGELPEPDSAA